MVVVIFRQQYTHSHCDIYSSITNSYTLLYINTCLTIINFLSCFIGLIMSFIVFHPLHFYLIFDAFHFHTISKLLILQSSSLWTVITHIVWWLLPFFFQFSSVTHVRLFVTHGLAANQASLSITNSWSLLKVISIESLMPFNHLILCCPFLPNIIKDLIFSSLDLWVVPQIAEEVDCSCHSSFSGDKISF